MVRENSGVKFIRVWRNWLAQLSYTQEVAGSSPATRTYQTVCSRKFLHYSFFSSRLIRDGQVDYIFASIVQRTERQFPKL